MSDVIRLDAELKELINSYRKAKLANMYLNYAKLRSLTKEEDIIEISDRLIKDFKSKSDKGIIKDLLLMAIDKYERE